MRDQLTEAILDHQPKTLDQVERDAPATDRTIGAQVAERRADLDRLARSQTPARDIPIVLYVSRTEVEAVANADDKPVLAFLESQGIETGGGLNGEQRLAAAMMRQSLDRVGPRASASKALLVRELWRRLQKDRHLVQIVRSDAAHLPAVQGSDWRGFPNVLDLESGRESQPEHEKLAAASPAVEPHGASRLGVFHGTRFAVGTWLPALIVLAAVAYVIFGLVQPFERQNAALPPGPIDAGDGGPAPLVAIRDWPGPPALRITEPPDGAIAPEGFTVRGRYLAAGSAPDVRIFILVFPHDSCPGNVPGPWSPHCPGWVQSPRVEDGLPASIDHQSQTFEVGVWLGGENLRNLNYDLVAFLGDDDAAAVMKAHMMEPSEELAGTYLEEAGGNPGLRYDQLPPTLIEMHRITVRRRN